MPSPVPGRVDGPIDGPVVGVVPAGGGSLRFGPDKLAARLLPDDPRSVLDVVLLSLSAVVDRLVVVGPPRFLDPSVPSVLFVREEPVGSGPAAALAAGLRVALAAGADRVVVLPGDAPDGVAAVAPLLAALAGAPAAVGVDVAGREQPLQVALTAEAARRLLAGPPVTGGRARALLRRLEADGVLARVPLPPAATWDLDTRAALAAWRVRTSPAALGVLDVVRDVGRSAAPGLVVLDGRSASGKSTLAEVCAALGGAVVVDGDDFHVAGPSSAALSPARLVDATIDWTRLRAEALEPLLAGREAVWRPSDRDADDGSAAAPVRAQPGRVVVLDVTYGGHPRLADLVSAEVLVEADEDVRAARLAAHGDHDPARSPRREAAEDHYFAVVRPPSSFAVRVRT